MSVMHSKLKKEEEEENIVEGGRIRRCKETQ